ncbi:hypothetical protein ACFSTH_11825 [Paenibacillus yanchengensis]|uniref:Uncharacterized protein n=1 Tax=Paenibacillus yanchengensis TaxID=2035833 RepID=A0ABW4YR50_9BACL
METVIQLSSATLAIVTITTAILKLVSISKITRIEKTLLTDYKKTSTTFMEAFMIVFLFSLAATSIYIFANSNAKVESAIAFFLVMIFFSSLFLWMVYQLIILFRIKKVRYFIEEDQVKYYIHKSISESEIIISPEISFSNESDHILIRKRDYLHDKTIKKEII